MNTTDKPRPYTVGLTGGIASGKSTACHLFAELGAPIVDADIAARVVVEPGSPLLEDIAATFGADVLTDDGRLDRRRMRDVVFADPAKRERLEAILHPAIRKHMFEDVLKQTYPYVILAIPLLVEGEMQSTLDRIVVVDVDPTIQRERLMARDQINAASADAMIKSQASRDARLAAADDVIDNSGDETALRPQVARLHERYLALAAARGTQQ